MPSLQQENFRQMIDHVQSWFPQYDRAAIKRGINDHLQTIISLRNWSGLVGSGILAVPDSYDTGTISRTSGSNVATGSGTSWPTDDKVNTTLGSDIAETGNQDATPASMSGIESGRWLLMDAGGANEEAIFVISTTSDTFRAKFAKTHSAAETVTRSSLAGLQLRTDFQSHFYTVTGVRSSTALLTDLPWSSDTVSGKSYSISMVYTDFGVRDLKMLLSVTNLSRQFRLKLHFDRTRLDQLDPQRATTESTYLVSTYQPDPGGSQLFELYPRPITSKQFPFYYVRQWPRMESDNDILPSGIRSDYIVRLVKADAYMWPKHRRIDDGIYYDPRAAQIMKNEAVAIAESMQLEDDNTHITRLVQSTESLQFRYGANFWQSHDPDDVYGYV